MRNIGAIGTDDPSVLTGVVTRVHCFAATLAAEGWSSSSWSSTLISVDFPDPVSLQRGRGEVRGAG